MLSLECNYAILQCPADKFTFITEKEESDEDMGFGLFD